MAAEYRLRVFPTEPSHSTGEHRYDAEAPGGRFASPFGVPRIPPRLAPERRAGRHAALRGQPPQSRRPPLRSVRSSPRLASVEGSGALDCGLESLRSAASRIRDACHETGDPAQGLREDRVSTLGASTVPSP